MSMERVLALFPGQGSQRVGMGKALCESSTLARELFARADKVLGFSLSQICFEGPAEELTNTAVAQPAILTVSTICFELARARADLSLSPVAAAGHSLGEYSALVAAGALAFEDAVLLVHKRGTFMQEAMPAGQGKMAVVLGVEQSALEERVAQIAAQPGHVLQIANLNAPGQIVIAGLAASIDEFMGRFSELTTKLLPVSAPFHCTLMKPAEERLANELATVSLQRCAFPIYANYSACAVTEPDQIRESLRLQVCGRVRWIECMQNSIERSKPTQSIEFGAGAVLSGMLKRINPALPRLSVDSVESIAGLVGGSI